MKYLLCLFALLLFPILSVYAETDNVEITIVDGNEDPINPWGVYIEILEADNKTPILELDQPPNPSYISLEEGKYRINVYRHDMFVGYYILQIEDSFEKVRVPIADLGGILFTVKYSDLLPIQGAKIEIFSYKGTKWAEDTTGLDGRAERFWLQIPTEIDEHYSAKISLGDDITYDVSSFRFSKGYNNEVVITPWQSIVDDQVKIQLYKNIRQPLTNYDGKFVVELFDSNNEKITEYEVTTHGEAYFSNLPVGYYFLRVLEFPEDRDYWSESRQ